LFLRMEEEKRRKSSYLLSSLLLSLKSSPTSILTSSELPWALQGSYEVSHPIFSLLFAGTPGGFSSSLLLLSSQTPLSEGGLRLSHPGEGGEESLGSSRHVSMSAVRCSAWCTVPAWCSQGDREAHVRGGGGGGGYQPPWVSVI